MTLRKRPTHRADTSPQRHHNAWLVNVTARIRQRIRDYMREREIQRLSACQFEARLAGDKAKERQFDAARMQTIRERSAGQRARMDARIMKRAEANK